MVISRPSTVGDDTYAPYHSEDKKRAHRNKKAAASRRVNKFAHWGFTTTEAALFSCVRTRASHPHYISVGEAVEAVYKVKWQRMRPERRRRYLHCLRTLLHAVNEKLLEKDDHDRIIWRPRRDRLSLIHRQRWLPWEMWERAERRRYPVKNRHRPRELLKWCVDKIRLWLKRRPMPVAALNAKFLEYDGICPGTIRRAKKLASTVTYRKRGTGSDVIWMIRLPAGPPRPDVL